jgi:S-adenosylmethionine hydrolase
MKPVWNYKKPGEISSRSLHIEVIADYGGGHTTDHAFSEVRNHFLRFDTKYKIRSITEHPVDAFSTLETGFWIAQEGLHSEHPDLVIFSNTAPRGDIQWYGERRQAFVCGLLDNGIPVFAVDAIYNLSFVKHRLLGLWEINVTNEGTQFRSRDQYPEATMDILNGNTDRIGKEISIKDILEVPSFMIASIDGYGNLKTTIKKEHLSSSLLQSPVLRVTINGISQLVLNTLVQSIKTKTGDLCMVVGSSGGKKGGYIEFVRLQGQAADDYHLSGPRDDLDKIIIEEVKV